MQMSIDSFRAAYFKPHNKQEALNLLARRYPADMAQLRRKNYLQLYAICESIRERERRGS